MAKDPLKPVILPTRPPRQSFDATSPALSEAEALALWNRLTDEQKVSVVRLMRDLVEGERSG